MESKPSTVRCDTARRSMTRRISSVAPPGGSHSFSLRTQAFRPGLTPDAPTALVCSYMPLLDLIPDSNQKAGLLLRGRMTPMLGAAMMLVLVTLATAGPLNGRRVNVIDERQHSQGLSAQLMQPETSNICGVSPEVFE